jgi:hypothetical protein
LPAPGDRARRPSPERSHPTNANVHPRRHGSDAGVQIRIEGSLAIRPATEHSPFIAAVIRLAPAIVLIGLAAGLFAAAVLGPLVLGLIDWRISSNSLNQTYGADGAALVLLTPVAVAAGWLAIRRHRLAAPLAFGVGLAALYYGVASVLGADYARYDGNNERFFLAFLVIIVLAWVGAAWGWAAMDADPPRPGRTVARAAAIVFVAGGALIAAAWLVQLVQIAATGDLATAADRQAYPESPTAFWLVRIVVLGFIVPLAIGTGVGLWRANGTAAKAATGVAAFLTLQASAVLAMGTIMLLRGDPTATPWLVVILAPITVAIAALTLRLLASYAGDRPESVTLTFGG